MMADTARIHSLVAKARRRLRLQSALDAAVLAVIPASAVAAVSIYLIRSETIEQMAGLVALAAAAALVLIVGAVGWLRHFPTPLVATRIDRASGLADRLSSACDFEDQLRRGYDGPEETRQLMEAALADAAESAHRAQVKAATPFSWPRDTRAALGFLTAAVAVSGLNIVPTATEPSIARIEPPAAARGAEVELVGARFGDLEAGAVLFGEGPDARAAAVLAWKDDRIRIAVPSDAPLGPTMIAVRSAAADSAGRRFDVLRDGARYRDPDEPLALSEEDLGYTRDLLDELRQTALANQDDELTALAKEIEKLHRAGREGRDQQGGAARQAEQSPRRVHEGRQREDVRGGARRSQEDRRGAAEERGDQGSGQGARQGRARKGQAGDGEAGPEAGQGRDPGEADAAGRRGDGEGGQGVREARGGARVPGREEDRAGREGREEPRAQAVRGQEPAARRSSSGASWSRRSATSRSCSASARSSRPPTRSARSSACTAT